MILELRGDFKALSVELKEGMQRLQDAIRYGDREAEQLVTLTGGRIERLENIASEQKEHNARYAADIQDLKDWRTKMVGAVIGAALGGGGVAGFVIKAIGG